MMAGDRILLALDAHECWARGTRAPVGKKKVAWAPSPEVEPVVVGGGQDTFGSILGQMSVADLQDSMASWDYRMKQMGAAYAAFAPVWQARDSTAFTNWTADYLQLQNRYKAALAKAQVAVNASKTNFMTPNSMIMAPAEYDALAKAMRQCYPPDGCPVTKGDFDDLNNRLTQATAAAGATQPDYSHIPQPQATDVDLQVFKATAPVDVIAQVTGAQKPSLPGLGPAAQFWAWLVKHQKGVMIGGAAVVGGVLLIQIAPVLMLPFKAAKGLAAVAA